MLKNFKAIYWDFDGVIKDSVQIKTDGYTELFNFALEETKIKISEHQLKYGGISRFVKIPLYMQWSGISPDPQSIQNYLNKFAKLVILKVINSPWIPEVEKVLRSKNMGQNFFIVTGTPQFEIEEILAKLGIEKHFDQIFGTPLEKEDAIQKAIDTFHLSPRECLLIGDSEIDWLAAKKAGINFWLRSEIKNGFWNTFNCPTI